MKEEKKVIYYNDELSDDFAGTDIKKESVDESFPYIRKNPVWRFFATVLYYCVAMPLIWLYMRVLLRVKIVGKKSMKKIRNKPCFLYGNHTGYIDAFTPNILSFPRSNKIIVSAETVSIKGLRGIVQMLGAIPLPTGFRGMRQFVKAVEHHNGKSNITIYPEAHIWPYYTGVRNFKSSSFAYPVKCGSPTVAFFTAYTKPKGFLSVFRKANITVFVSEPMYPDDGLTGKDAVQNLRDKVYAFMKEKSQYSDYAVIEYVKRVEFPIAEEQQPA